MINNCWMLTVGQATDNCCVAQTGAKAPSRFATIPRSSERDFRNVLVTTRDNSCDETARADFVANYSFDAMDVARALLERIEKMADQRERFRRSLIFSVEMIEAPDFDLGSTIIE